MHEGIDIEQPANDCEATAELVPSGFVGPPVKFEVTEEQIQATRERYAALSAETPDGYQAVRRAIAHVRETRVAIEKRRVELKAAALDYGRQVDSAARRFTELLLEIEEPLKQKKDVVDIEKARAKREAEETKRREALEKLRLEREVEEARLRAAREAEEARLREEQARIEAERARLAEERRQVESAQRRESERLASERRAIEETHRAERERLVAEQRAELARMQVERNQLEQERRSLELERRRIEQAELERQAQIRAEREAREAVERERIAAEEARVAELERQAELRRRLEAIRPDLEKIQTFAVSIRGLQAPSVASSEAKSAVERAMRLLWAVAAELESFGAHGNQSVAAE